jgi:DNA polymerase elongation subunit (family B)
METIGEGKDDFDARKTWEAWAAGGAERERMAVYCDKDSLLLPKIEAKTGYLALNASVCEVCRVFSDTASATPTAFVDGFMLRMGVERGMRFRTRPHALPEDERKKYAGAWVLEPQVTGIRKNVHVVDFSGMYPSIIQTFNMSPETVDPLCPVNGPIPPGIARAPATRVGFRTDVVGLLSLAVAEMKRLRKFWSKKQAILPPGSAEWWEAARRSAAYKVVVNIFYGIAGSPHSRYSDTRVAESVSTTGVWLIHKTIHAGADRGLWAIYSDTDSSFFESKPGAPPIVREVLVDFVAWCNKDLYPAAVREIGCVENHIDLAYEKVFERLILVSKKRYCAVYREYKGTATCTCDKPAGEGKTEPGSLDVLTMTCRDCGRVWDALPPPRGKPEIRGLEYRRGDVARLARELQGAAVDLFMRERCEDPAAFVPLVEAAQRRILHEPLAVDDVSFSQSLTKSLKEYERARKPKADGTLSSEPAHVQVARILRGRGEQVVEGMKISYVVVDGGVSPMKVIPAVDYAGECDRYSLWEDDVYPATRRLLEAAFPVTPGMSADELRLRDWGRFAKVRPKKERTATAPPSPDGNPGSGRKRKTVEGQADLFAPPIVALTPGGKA